MVEIPRQCQCGELEPLPPHRGLQAPREEEMLAHATSLQITNPSHYEVLVTVYQKRVHEARVTKMHDTNWIRFKRNDPARTFSARDVLLLLFDVQGYEAPADYLVAMCLLAAAICTVLLPYRTLELQVQR